MLFCQGEEFNVLHLKAPVEMMQDVANTTETYDIKNKDLYNKYIKF